MKRSQILESLTMKEAGTGLWEWELVVTFQSWAGRPVIRGHQIGERCS